MRTPRPQASVQERVKRARTALVALIDQVAAIPQDADLTADDARTAREMLRAAPLDDDRALAEHLESAWAVVTPAYDAVVQRAQQLIEQSADVWAPAIQTLALWVEAAEQYVTTEDRRSLAEKAQKWLKSNAEMLRNERLAPMAEQSARIWAALRQESNVELGNILLTGQGNHRRVQLLATVDGTSTEAFSVMSQGELHALALAIFLPRAIAPASPFRFVVLDDPIQAMDPSKIEGFLDVLNEIARTRQVVVLTHDDRLPAAIRRRQQAARLIEVTRGSLSAVTVKDASRPAQRMLDDADALLKDEKISVAIKARTVPVLCRNAVEQTAWEVYGHRALAGSRHGHHREHLERDAVGQGARGTGARTGGTGPAGLAVGHRAHAMHTINTGVLKGIEDVREALNKVRATVTDLRAVMT